MAVNNEARQRRGILRKKVHTLHILYKADIALIGILGSKRCEYRSDDITIWPPAPQIVRLSQNSIPCTCNTDAKLGNLGAYLTPTLSFLHLPSRATFPRY